MSNPILKIIDGPSLTSEGLSQVTTNGAAPILSAASKAAEYFPHDQEGLIQILHFRIQIAKAAKKRSRWFGGRIYNRFSGEGTDYIPLSGTHLRQSFSILKIETPEIVVPQGKYYLRLDVSEEALKTLSDNQNTPA
jgi:hypothetical protein